MKFQSVLLSVGVFVLTCGSMSASAVIHSSVFDLQDCSTNEATAASAAADDCIGTLDAEHGTVNPSEDDINNPLSITSGYVESQGGEAWYPGAFGFNDWTEAARFEKDTPGEANDLGLTVSSGGADRTWSVDTPLNGMWILVVKQSSQAVLYLFDELAAVTGGTINLSRFDNENDYSHVSLLTRDSGGQVPLPGTLALVALGIVTLIARRRKSRLSAKA